MKVGRLAAKPEKRTTMQWVHFRSLGSETLDSLMLTKNGKGYTVRYS